MAFLRAAERRPNLRIETGRRCAKVLFEGSRAVGVALEDGAEFRSRREVILAAGALESPRLLQLSGIGNARDLSAHGIASIADLPGVGENYQDHAETPVQAEVQDMPSLFKQDRGLRAVGHMLQHVVNHASYHRGQVTTMLRQLGAPGPKSQDMILFFRERLPR